MSKPGSRSTWRRRRFPPSAQRARSPCLLVAAGARSISMDYAEGGKVVGMNFVLMIGGLPYPFKMPVRTQAVHEIFRKRRIATMKWRADEFEAKDREQAERVAWRQLLRWVQAQLAMVDCGMAQAREVFAPYLLDPSGMTSSSISRRRALRRCRRARRPDCIPYVFLLIIPMRRNTGCMNLAACWSRSCGRTCKATSSTPARST